MFPTDDTLGCAFPASLMPLCALAALVVGGLVGPLRAEEVVHVGDWTLTVWTVADGLPSNVVRGLAQSRDGYLWVATFGGLARFDGRRFEIFDPVRTPELGGARFWGLLVDRRGTLWAGGTDGNVAICRDGQFSRVGRLAFGNVRSIVEDRDGTIWFGGSRGVFRYDKGAFRKVSERPVWNLCVDQNNGVWGGGHEGVLCFHDNTTDVVLGGDHGASVRRPVVPLPNGGLAALVGDEMRRLPSGDPLVINLPLGSVFGGAVDRQGCCWWATASGLYRIVADDLADDRIVLDPRHLVLPPEFRIRVVFEDRDANLWLGSENGGLMLLQRRFCRSLEHRFTLIPMEDGSYWALLPHPESAVRMNNGSVVERLELPQVRSIAAARNGGIWVIYGGAESPQLARYTTGNAEPHPWPETLQDDFPLWEDRSGRLWQRTAWDQRQTIALKDGQVVERVPGDVIGETHTGDLWFSLGPRQLARFRRGQIESVPVPTGELPVEFRGVHEDDHGRVWVTTYGEGLWCVDGDRVTRLTVQHGLPNAMLGEIAEDAEGRFWINSNRGLFVVYLDDLVRATQVESHQVSCQAITGTEMSNSKIGRQAGNRLVFSTVDGAVEVNPRAIPVVPPPPPTRIERIGSRPTRRRNGGKVELPVGQRTVDLTYGAPYLLPVGGLKFRYRLEGIDREWVDAGDRREAFYGPLPPGEYTFRVLARNAAGQLGQADTMTFVLPYRFYETGWFRGLVIAVVATAVIGLLGTQLRVIRAQRRALAAEAERHRIEEEVHGQRDQLARVARAASLGELATSIAHEVNQPLAAIISNANAARHMMDAASPDVREIRAALDDIVTGGNLAAGVIKRVRLLVAKQQVGVQRVDLNRVVRDTLQLVTPEMEKRGVSIDLELARDLPPVKGDAIELQQVMLNLLVNGAQAMENVHADGRVLSVRSAALPGEHLVSVEDNGIGFNDETKEQMFEPFFTTRSSGVGMGLSINRTIIQFRGGRLWATRNQQGGATFHFTVPIFTDSVSTTGPSQERES